MITAERLYTKERHYGDIAPISRLKGGITNKGTSIFTKDYQGLDFQSRTKRVANQASDNGRCWWIHDYILRNLRLDSRNN